MTTSFVVVFFSYGALVPHFILAGAQDPFLILRCFVSIPPEFPPRPNLPVFSVPIKIKTLRGAIMSSSKSPFFPKTMGIRCSFKYDRQDVNY